MKADAGRHRRIERDRCIGLTVDIVPDDCSSVARRTPEVIHDATARWAHRCDVREHWPLERVDHALRVPRAKGRRMRLRKGATANAALASSHVLAPDTPRNIHVAGAHASCAVLRRLKPCTPRAGIVRRTLRTRKFERDGRVVDLETRLAVHILTETGVDARLTRRAEQVLCRRRKRRGSTQHDQHHNQRRTDQHLYVSLKTKRTNDFAPKRTRKSKGHWTMRCQIHDGRDERQTLVFPIFGMSASGLLLGLQG